jgi:hypothetical protein
LKPNKGGDNQWPTVKKTVPFIVRWINVAIIAAKRTTARLTASKSVRTKTTRRCASVSIANPLSANKRGFKKAEGMYFPPLFIILPNLSSNTIPQVCRVKTPPH